MRNWLVFGFLVMLIVIPFLIWGNWFTELFTSEEAIRKLEASGPWAWAVGIVLLIGDLFLPLPATIIMSALGYVYGPLWGGFIASLGSFLSGMLAYGLSRALGLKAALFILGEEDLAKGQRLFTKNGGWIVAISRWLPVLPEAIACMAGLNQMPFRKFVLALACGSLPLGFVFAYIGAAGIAHPRFALLISALLPLLLWFAANRILRKLTTVPPTKQ